MKNYGGIGWSVLQCEGLWWVMSKRRTWVSNSKRKSSVAQCNINLWKISLLGFPWFFISNHLVIKEVVCCRRYYFVCLSSQISQFAITLLSLERSFLYCEADRLQALFVGRIYPQKVMSRFLRNLVERPCLREISIKVWWQSGSRGWSKNCGDYFIIYCKVEPFLLFCWSVFSKV